MTENNKLIKKIINKSNESKINFLVKFKTNSLEQINKNKIEKIFSLMNTINMNNMHLHDINGKIKKYFNVIQILEEFYEIRLEFYQKRKNYLLKKMNEEIEILNSKIKFIYLVIDKKVKLVNISKDALIKILRLNKLLEFCIKINLL